MSSKRWNLELTILGSGGVVPTPRWSCRCPICQRARRLGEPYKRTSSALYINAAHAVIDCGETIGESLTRRGVTRVDSLFITHWHPDHLAGIRRVLEDPYDFWGKKSKRPPVQVYVPDSTFDKVMERMPVLSYNAGAQKTAVLRRLPDREKVELGGGISVTVVNHCEGSTTSAYLIEGGGKRVLYSPCDTEDFTRCEEFTGLDAWISEFGLPFQPAAPIAITFDEVMTRARKMEPRRAIMTHIEEQDEKYLLEHKGVRYFRALKAREKPFIPRTSLEFAHDGMRIRI